MSEKAFSNELDRALARPDADQLKAVVAAYHHWSTKNLTEKDWPEGLDVWFEADRDPDLGLALIILAAATCDDPDFLGVVSAGLLEELIRNPSDELLQRILGEARKTARFRWMLDVPFRHAIENPEVRAAIDEAIGDMNCDGPLPPRPWA